MDRRSFCATASTVAAAAFFPWRVRATAPYPGKPIRVISPYAAGGGPDLLLRQVGPALGQALGQPIVIENKVGAGGVLAAIHAAQQPADGYLLLMGANTHLVQKAMQPELGFDPIADFAPVSNFATSPAMLVVNAGSAYQKLDDLMAAAKTWPGQMNYGSGGIGTAAHLAGATLVSLMGIEAVHVPLKGSVEISASLLRGDTQFAFPIAGTAVPQVKGGKLRALAVTSRSRLQELPELPTLHELLGGNELAIQESWFGLWAPARTPAQILATLNAAVKKVVATPSLRSAAQALGTELSASASPQACAAFVRSENLKWAELVRLAGVSGG
ncbi:tripartite tricarboxylate transporter substrate binding protein [Verminephrobacter eiseniae]|uniref:tripartite tricarboxylate transporter substrate-binding protein n=1 Tax=Verminephrobacter eiseniae TaxID=364317 RepID=UPI002238C7EB|nr:tripartite tricarboxylate transporter substrate-binding protein [Verminephrobacter eiseniae]MCW5261434.1 tripartite tricarboxylate transporter substrate binding protein [Verminephrobacter eiseniae]